MSQDQPGLEPSNGEQGAQQEKQGQPPPTPFDHPLFLPILLSAGALWFGYDGWINQDPDMLEHLAFNRWGFGILVLLTAWFGYKGWNEFQQDRASKSDGGQSDRGD